ncbi:nitric oxide reductase [Neisseria gonorrhoeae]|uniref:Nitric oxide reductase n=1 Tax=Neisseria gonorrhoeae TaxID=485 RepID=A0A379B1M5_NEIGO|nr:nitric oxide reductase [Neisseria gonorrhoeae]
MVVYQCRTALDGHRFVDVGYSFLTKHEEVEVPSEDPISKIQLTPSQKHWANTSS